MPAAKAVPVNDPMKAPNQACVVILKPFSTITTGLYFGGKKEKTSFHGILSKIILTKALSSKRAIIQNDALAYLPVNT